MIDESLIRQIVREEISKFLLEEGIDIKQINKKKIVSVSNNHQNFVDTNNSHAPYLFVDEQRGFRTLSIFQRKATDDCRTDSNPLLNALKQRKGWEFQNATSDLMKLLRNFVAASHLLPQYDTIIMTPSNNPLNEIVFRYLIRLVKHNYMYTKFFLKYTANDVYENFIDDNYINANFPYPAEVYNDLDDAISLMNLNNNGIFSYKYLQNSAYREAIIQSMEVNMGPHNCLNYADSINGKDVLVFDDTITTGKTISDSGNAIKAMFAPKSITFITLFSALNDENSNQQQLTSI